MTRTSTTFGTISITPAERGLCIRCNEPAAHLVTTRWHDGIQARMSCVPSCPACLDYFSAGRAQA